MEIEKEVILLMSQGDEKAYGIMFRKFYPKVHRFVSMLLKNMDDADDVCQIIFEKIGSGAEVRGWSTRHVNQKIIIARYMFSNKK